MSTTFTIGEVAATTGLSPDTLRYYERIGLIDAVHRGPNGHRRYDSDDLTWLEFLNRLRATGMPIVVMTRFAELRRQGASTLEQRRQILEDHQRLVEGRIDELGENLAAIRRKITRLESRPSIDGPVTA